VVCLAPRAREDSVRPRRRAGVVVRPLNFTVRRRGELSATFSDGVSRLCCRIQECVCAAQQQVGRKLHCLSPGVVCFVSLDKLVGEIHVQEIA
jgi:hypothetical protein